MQTNMDHAANRSSSMVPSLAEDEPSSSMEASSVYSSPVSTMAPRAGFPALVGLGISNCGLEPMFDQSASTFSVPAPYSSSPLDLSPNSLSNPSAVYEYPIKPHDISNEACFPIYNNFTDVSLSSLSLYGSQPMSASPSYNLNLEIPCTSSQGTLNQVPGYWAAMPSSAPASPLEAVSASTAPPVGHQQLYEQSQNSISLNAPRLTIDPEHPCLTPIENGKTLVEPRPASAQSESYSFVNISSESSDNLNASESIKPYTIPTEARMASDTSKGFICRTCGKTFTRKSNCRVHEKRHDPNARTTFKCTECQKVLGRKTDLRRHIENIHRQNHSHSCEWCGGRFARAEALETHVKRCIDCPTNLASYPLSYAFKEGKNHPVPTKLAKKSPKHRQARTKC